MVHGPPAYARSAPVRFSDLPAQRTLTSAQTVDLVLAAVAACNEAIPGVSGLPLPGADRVFLHPDGRVTVDAPARPGDDRQRMLAVATLLRDLLSLEAPAATGRAAVPGPLLMLLARALGTIDLPAPSFEGFCQALARFGSVSPGLPPQDVAPPPAVAVPPLPEEPAVAPLSAHSPSDRRRQDAHVAVLRREIRLRDRELFEAQASHHGVPIAAAVAIWLLAIPMGALLMRGGLELLDGQVRSVEAREIADERPTNEDLAPTIRARTAPPADKPAPAAPRVNAGVRANSHSDAGNRAARNGGAGVNGASRSDSRASGREPRRRTASRPGKHGSSSPS